MTRKKTKRTKGSKANHTWDALHYIHNNCLAYTIAPAMLGPFMRNKELLEKVTDMDNLLSLSKILARDVAVYSQELKNIQSQYIDKKGSSKNADELMMSIQISEQYVHWAASYDAVIMPTIVSILGIFEEAGADTSSSKINSAASSVNIPVIMDTGEDEDDLDEEQEDIADETNTSEVNVNE